MKSLSVLAFISSLSLCVFQQKQETNLIEECVRKSYTLNSCEKVFCQPWERCMDGSCSCKLPYQCPKNGTSVCSTDKRTLNYCQLKSLECQRKNSRFMNRGRCNPQDSFQIYLKHENATSKGIIQVEVNHSPKTFVCGSVWSMNEANVACRHLGFPEGADRTEVVDPEDASHFLECLRAKCRGIETSLAECTLERMNRSNEKVAKVVCHTAHKECSLEQFRCVNRKCIPSDQTCNGINECGDLSDEVCCNGDKRTEESEKGDTRAEDNKSGNKRAEENEREGTREAEESMDEERKKIKALLPQLHCGIVNHTVTRRKRILGGNTAGKDEFPWQVAIRGERGSVNCGGVYIGGCWILTAAHCVTESRVHIYKIWTGMLDSIAMDTAIETFSLVKVIVHEKYNSQTYENDIALLEMKPKDKATSPTCSPPDSVPVCIPWSQYMFRGSHQCKVSGWGLTEGFKKQYVLKWGYIYLMENCSEIYKERYFEGMECAGTDDGSVDSCKGDSGGPLVCFDSNGVGYLWGIVSWGENCGEKGHPGVYTKIANYFNWIGRHTGMNLISQYNL
ncbi:complement factor I-like isoform X2 [Rhineura floridana]|uniref:complement factor I-like isoform X2 n=1 Tax=Rhineura floridana TaxID=261503 RepID=UPI002AC85E7F|nr:complement factor I-like isoform X2 [Rhineura floridana]